MSADQARGEQSEEANIRAEIVENHAGPQMFRENGLHGEFRFAAKIILTGAGIQFEPETLRAGPFSTRAQTF